MPKTRKIGPIAVSLVEPASFIIESKENRISAVEIQTRFSHRAIEQIAERMNRLDDVLFIIERICGLCSHCHTTAYVQAVENILGIDPPRIARYVRTIMGEMERIQSHMWAISELAHRLDLDQLAIRILKDREKNMGLLELITGNRVHYGVNRIGGVRIGISPKLFRKITQNLNEYMVSIASYIKEFERPRARRKTVGKGILTKEEANRLHVVGPVARGSGISSDIRMLFPYAAYDELVPEEKLKSEGDVEARTMVRLEELLESASLIKLALESFPSNKTLYSEFRIISGRTSSRTEAPRGENVHYVQINEYNRLEKIRITVPTMSNLKCLPVILAGEKTEDFDIILASIDPCISCNDR